MLPARFFVLLVEVLGFTMQPFFAERVVVKSLPYYPGARDALLRPAREPLPSPQVQLQCLVDLTNQLSHMSENWEQE